MGASQRHEMAGELDHKHDTINESSSESIDDEARVASSDAMPPDGSSKTSRIVCVYCPGAALMEIWRRERYLVS